MGLRERVNRRRRRRHRIDDAERQLFGVDPYADDPPLGLHFDVKVQVHPGHSHYGVYTDTVNGVWPNISFTAWHDCRVCGHLS